MKEHHDSQLDKAGEQQRRCTVVRGLYGRWWVMDECHRVGVTFYRHAEEAHKRAAELNAECGREAER